MNPRLTFAICSALAAAAAHAVHLNPHGTGEALVFPYYTVNGGNTTLLLIGNTQNAGKAVKVRFLESQDARDTLDLNLYLSPYDIWVAQVVPSGDGAALFTNDNSCTIPTIPNTAAAALPFSTAAFDGHTAQLTDSGPTDVARTREGSIEVIEMGTVVNGTHDTLKAITHSNGVPSRCDQIATAWNDYWKTSPNDDLSSPSGGLFGSGTILNAGRGTVEAYNAEAIAQFYTPDSSPQHTAAAALTPNLATGTSKTSITLSDDGAITTPFEHSIDAVSALFMADQILNDYVISTSIGASTEWVVSLPTKRFYTDPYYLAADATTGRMPFDKVFGLPVVGAACSSADEAPFNREEATLSTGAGFPEMPPPPPPPTCYSMQVTTFAQPFDQPSHILGANHALPFGRYGSVGAFQSGWALITLFDEKKYPNHTLTGTNGNVFRGLPVTGFSVTEYVNGDLNGVLSNYTALSVHRTHVRCDRGDPSLPCS
ncbi:MAG TPA: hypothetical protein VF132_15210 [Rudaea sp.]